MSTSKSHENEIEIAAPPADVWRALTEGEELTRWFAVKAEVEPREGGRWKVSWDESPVAEYSRIEVFEPNKHLRLVNEIEREGEVARLLHDFELIAIDGGARTLLRLVASGFGSDASWDDEFYEGTKNGWAVFFRNLQHYLERHRGERCRSVGLPFGGLSLRRQEAFERLFGAGGALAIDGALEVGRRVTIPVGFGAPLSATIDFARPPALLGLVVDGLGLLRAEFVGSEKVFVCVMLLAHGESNQAGLDRMGSPLAEVIGSALRGEA